MNIHVNWRALVLVVVLGVIIAWAIRTIQGWPEAQFTAQEKRMVEVLAPVLDTLVLQQGDLASLSSHFEPCQGGESSGLTFESSGEGQLLEVEDVRRGDPYDGPIDYSSFCDNDSGAFASSYAALPHDKETLLFWQNVNADLERADSADVDNLAEANSDDLHEDEELLDYRTLNAPALGDSRWAWARTVDNLERGQRFEMYDFVFTRGILMAGLGVELPSSPTAENEARAVAQAFDDRIAAQLQLLAPEVHRP